MEILKRSVTSNKYSLFVLSDIHKGNANHAKGAWLSAIKHIAKIATTRTVEVIINGDVADCINIHDKRFNPAEIAKQFSIRDLKDLPRKQCDIIAKELEPIKDLIIGYVIGNHEEKFIKNSGFDVYDYLASKFPNCKKMGFTGYYRLCVSKHGKGRQVDIVMTHGAMAGQDPNTAYKIFNDKFEGDIFIAAHNHKLDIKEISYINVDKALKFSERIKYFVNCGGFLKTYVEGNRNYFEGRKGLLSDIGFIEIQLDLKKSWELKIKKRKFKKV